MNWRRVTSLCIFCLAMCWSMQAIAKPPVASRSHGVVEHVVLEKGTAEAMRSTLEKLRGHVVIVNFWATWCGPCVAEFPELIGLAKKYASQGVRLLTVSLDQSSAKKQVIAFLERHDAPSPAFLASTNDALQFLKPYDPKMDGAIPRTYVFDRRGRLRYRVVGEIDAQKLDHELQSLVALGHNRPPTR